MGVVFRIGMCPSKALAYLEPLSYSPRCTEIVKKVPGLSWDYETKRWKGYPDAVAAASEALLHGGPNNTPVVAAISGTITTPDDVVKAADELTPPLRKYQKEGVEFLATMSFDGVFLSDDVGLGKSAQALFAAETLLKSNSIPQNALVVCPAVVKPVWASEAKKWKGNVFSPIVLSGTKECVLPEEKARSPLTPLYIINYDIIHAWADQLKNIGVLILDEAHMLQSVRSRRSVATKKVAVEASARMALSATPMQVRPKDLWNVLDTLAPGRWGENPWTFYRRYCNAHQETVAKDTVIWNLDGSSNEVELAFRLKWVMLRRSKADVMTELPARVYQVIDVKVPSKAIAPIWRTGWKRSPKDTLMRALALSGQGKIDSAVELAVSRYREGHSCVLFTHLRQTARDTHEKLARKAKKGGVGKDNAELLTGNDPIKHRTQTIDKLRRRGTPSILVTTIDAVGVGVDLSFADIVIFIDLDWVPSKLIQSIGRCHRHGQRNTVVVYFLIGIGTADEYVREKVISRLDLFEKVIGNAAEAAELKKDLDLMGSRTEEEVMAELRAMILDGKVFDDDTSLFS